jgi:hypothetical protein
VEAGRVIRRIQPTGATPRLMRPSPPGCTNGCADTATTSCGSARCGVALICLRAGVRGWAGHPDAAAALEAGLASNQDRLDRATPPSA